ncbi:MAG: DUF1570 domain-containing protein [Planctomycetota bacterium]
MNRSLHTICLSLFLLPLWLGTSLGDDREKGFKEALELVDRTMGPGRWSRAKEILLTALKENEGAPFVLYNALAVKDAMKSCAFWLANEAPEPKDCVSGELLSYSASKGQIEIRYRDEPNGRKPASKLVGKSHTQSNRPARFKGFGFSDFRETGTLRFHPAQFDGAFTIEIEGRGGLTSGSGSMVLVCLDWGRAYVIVFESVGRGSVVVGIVRVENGDAELLASSDPVVIPNPHDLKIAVASSSINVHSGGAKLVSARKDPEDWGQFAFTKQIGVDQITIRGDIQTAFMQGAIDAAMQKDRADFESKYDPKADLPAWFVEKTAARAGHAASMFVPPGKADAKQAEHMQRLQTLLDKEPLLVKDVEEELEKLKAIEDAEIVEETRCWIASVLLDLLDRNDEALVQCQKVRELAPSFVPARIAELRLHDERGERDIALARCRELIAVEPLRAEGYEQLAGRMLGDEKIDDARAAIHAGIDAGVPSDELASIGRMLMRCEKGPTWPRTYTYKSEHYDVSSDISSQVCFRAATLLEKYYQKFNVHLKRIAKADKRRFPVYLFAGEAGYHAYTKELIGRKVEHTAGLYSPIVKQLLIWNLPDMEEMLRTVRHEGFHQYFDQMVRHHPPIWLNEGLAQYYEGSKLVKGAWSDGELLPSCVETLRSTKLRPLKAFLWMKPRAFQDAATMSLNYAEAWAFVHLLLNGTPEHRRRFDALMDGLVGGMDAEAALEKAFGDADFAELEADLARYIREKLL